MAKSRSKYKFNLNLTATEMRDKRYRKYLYPTVIDGIEYQDDTEKKLSESSWFRCLPPKRQIAIEKEMRLRAQGAFNHPILTYRDADTDYAPAIPAPVCTRLAESLRGIDIRALMSMIPYIHPNDGSLRNSKNALFTFSELAAICHYTEKTTNEVFVRLTQKRAIFFIGDNEAKREYHGDLFLDLIKEESLPLRMKTLIDGQRRMVVYINPYIVFCEQYIDKYVVPFFQNSGWYVINPYATKIAEWININCK